MNYVGILTGRVEKNCVNLILHTIFMQIFRLSYEEMILFMSVRYPNNLLQY